MKVATILMSLLFAGSVFAQTGAEAPAAPAENQVAAPAEAGHAHGKKEHKKKHKKAKKGAAEETK